MFHTSAVLELIFDKPGADELLPLCTRHRLSIAGLMRRNEQHWRSDPEKAAPPFRSRARTPDAGRLSSAAMRATPDGLLLTLRWAAFCRCVETPSRSVLGRGHRVTG